MSVEPVSERWRAFGWHVLEIDGHNFEEILSALDKAQRVTGKPTMIIAHTVKGKGVSYMEGTLSFHGKAPSKDELIKAHTEFDIAKKRLEIRKAAPPAEVSA
jgi:transketolase